MCFCETSVEIMVEIRAGILLLEWVITTNIANICILTDCLVFVQGPANPGKAGLSLQLALFDFIFLCSSFNSVN